MGNASGTIGLIYIIITICCIILAVLIGIMLFVWWKNRNSAKNFSKFADSKIEKGKHIMNKRQSLFKGQNPFKFSDLAKNLMINEKIDASSIKSSSSVGSKNKNNKRNDDNEKEIVINDNILNKDAKNKINKSIDDIEIDSDKESIINILSSFVNK